MHWTSTTPTETMEWRHSAFPEMEKSSSFSALINYRYIADSTTRSWWRVCSAKTIEKKSEWTFTLNNIQFICRNKPTSHINHLESAFNFVIISTSCYIFRKKKTHTVFFCMVQHSTVISSLTYSSFFTQNMYWCSKATKFILQQRDLSSEEAGHDRGEKAAVLTWNVNSLG